MTTLKNAKTVLRAVGMSINKRNGECRVSGTTYRVGFPGNADSAYFTDDINDAVATGLAMAGYAMPDNWSIVVPR